jgi:hypothetical protein
MALSPTVQAQRTPLACQGDEAAGLNWKDGQWQVARFHTSKFILVQEGSLITDESAAKAMNQDFVDCNSGLKGLITCNTLFGGILFFDPISKQGAIAKLYGAAVMRDGKRDSVFVQPFTCQPF